MHVGGCYGRWEVLMAGTAMLDLGPTADHAPTDHLAIESKCWKLLEADSRGNQFNGVDIEGGFVRILGEKSNEAKDARHAKHASGDIVDPNELAERFVTYEDMEVLLRYVTPVIQRAVTAGTLEAVSSFTDVSVLFLGISGVDLAAKCEDSSMIWGQVIMGTVQASVFDHEGTVNKFVMDDKGALLLCAWGLPPMAHADDPHRATQAALNISTQLEALGIKAHIGVTTGKVFAGVIGPPHRCEYSLLGDTVNLSARLMGNAPFGGVLCDLGTYTSAVATGMDFEVLEPIKVKGKEHLQAVFKPVVKAAEQSDQATPLRSKPKNARASMWQGNTVDNFDSGAKLLSEGKMRTKERQELLNILDRFYKGSGGTVVLTGDAGTGKSELAKLVLKSTANYDSLLIESLTPKKKGLLSEVISKPCIELSQILQGLLIFHTQLSTSNKIVAAEAGGGGDSRRRKFSEKDRSLSYTFDFSTDFEEPDN
jgi:class 3 adenylate cyclase